MFLIENGRWEVCPGLRLPTRRKSVSSLRFAPSEHIFYFGTRKKAKNWKFQMCFKKNSYLSISLEGLVHLVHSVLIELKKEDNKIKHISAWCLFSLNSYLLFTYLMWISLNDGYGNSKSCTLKWMFFCSIFFSKSFWNDVQFHFALHIST